MRSLRRRAWVSGGLVSLIAVTTGVLLLYSFLESEALQRFDLSLRERHTQAVVALSRFADDPARVDEVLLDPEYDRPASGRYWQVVGPDGEIYASASLLEATLPLSNEAAPDLAIHDAQGADGEPYRMAHQVITLEDGTRWEVAVAMALAGLELDRAEARRSLAVAFSLMVLVGLAGMVAQTAIMLRPIRRLRQDVAHRWEKGEVLDSSDYPEEVAPLVDDINYLLQRNLEIVRRSRQQAADLAHALKTPSAILRNEIMLLPDREQVAGRALDALDRLDAQLARSLARIRTSNTAEASNIRTDVTATVQRFSRMFSKLAANADKALTVEATPGLSLRADPQDFEEVLGNILDNALKWSRTRIVVTARNHARGIEILVQDDGPGIPEEERSAALVSGKRLDASVPGAGLGLAITAELLKAYGGKIELQRSEDLGGLAVLVIWPTAPTQLAG